MSAQPPRRVHVEVVYALRERQALLSLEVEEGATARNAIERSGILRRYPQIDLARDTVGVFGRIVDLDAPLRDGDRVEIYRTLIADPKEARRTRATRAVPARRGR